MNYITRRLLVIFPTLWGVSLLSFFILQLLPGGPLESKIRSLKISSEIGAEVSPQVLKNLNAYYGFDRPLGERYVLWISNLIRGNWGSSFTYKKPVIEVIGGKLPVTLYFGVTSFIIAFFLSIPLAIFQIYFRQHLAGYLFDILSAALFATPVLVLGLLIKSVGGGWRGQTELSALFNWIAPLFCYSVGQLILLSSLIRSALSEELNKEYVRTAFSKGLTELNTLYFHVLKNSLIPLITSLTYFSVVYFTGSIVVEQLFGIDGMGQLSFFSALDRDYNVLMALIILQALIISCMRLISDVLYHFIDPRMRLR